MPTVPRSNIEKTEIAMPRAIVAIGLIRCTAKAMGICKRMIIPGLIATTICAPGSNTVNSKGCIV